MSYTRINRRKHQSSMGAIGRKGGQTVPLAGLLDALFASPIDLWSSAAGCPLSAPMLALQVNTAALDASWKPTGVYTWNDLADMTAAVAQLSSQASSMATNFFAGSSTPDAKDKVRAAAAKYNAVAQQAGSYVQTWQQAKAQNVPVAAPGFRQWVIDDLKAALELLRTIEVAQCNSPWWVATLAAVGVFFNAVIETAKKINGVLQKVGQAVIKATERSADLLAFLISYGPYIAIGGGALYLWSKTRK